MNTSNPKLEENKENYIFITRLLYASFVINAVFIVGLNINAIEIELIEIFGSLTVEIFKQFFIGSIGATIVCSRFLSADQEINTLESKKESPDPEVLIYPNKVDAHLYVQRIIASGILAVLGVFVLLAGFSYLDVDFGNLTSKHIVLFSISSMLIGLFQHRFLKFLYGLFDKFFKREEDRKDDSKKSETSKKTSSSADVMEKVTKKG